MVRYSVYRTVAGCLVDVWDNYNLDVHTQQQMAKTVMSGPWTILGWVTSERGIYRSMFDRAQRRRNGVCDNVSIWNYRMELQFERS